MNKAANLLALGLAMSACKPNTEVASVKADQKMSWRAATTVTSSGEVSVVLSGNGASLTDQVIDSLSVGVSNTTETRIQANNVAEKRWLPLAPSGGVQLKLWLDTKSSTTSTSVVECSVPDARLNGQAQTVNCDDGSPSLTQLDQRKLEDLRRVCERLAALKIEGKNDNYARYNRNGTTCVCYNGTQRALAYADYIEATPSEFEDDCRREGHEVLELPTSEGDDERLRRLKALCKDDLGYRLSADETGCLCARDTLLFQSYRDNTDDYFRRVCRGEL